MNRFSGENFLRPVNGFFDKTGRINSRMKFIAPIYAIPCEWPKFPLLPPPIISRTENERKDQEFNSR